MNAYKCNNKKCDKYKTCCHFKCFDCEFKQDCKSKNDLCSYINNKINNLKIGDKLIVTDQLNNTYKYEFIKYNPSDTDREIILKNLTINTITEVEKMWFQVRNVEFLQ